SRNGTALLDLRPLARGVYLVKLEAGGFRTTTKLVVE
ncbi:T9SS type A sorting domain-containing protein, partial [candidate division WOR-3 bacterium]|nr:T9SS type A sorting domain-containing protein [candidate division WOR-3 bacterium]